MTKKIKVFLIACLTSCVLLAQTQTQTQTQAQAQKFLQLETKNIPKVVKFYIGDKISYKTNGAEGWQTRKIENMLIQDSVITFANGYQNINNLTNVRIPRHALGAITNKLMQFGAVWTVYMMIGEPFIDGKQITTTGLIIGGGSFLGGWLIKKIFYYQKYKLGNRHRLRLLDLSMK